MLHTELTTAISSAWRHCKAPVVALVCALGLAACNEEPSNRVTWAPDGTTMAVIGADGLHVADASGKISKLLGTGVGAVEWLPDSQRAAVLRKTTLQKWSDLAKLMTPDEIAAVEKEVALIVDLVRSGVNLEKPNDATSEKLDKLAYGTEDLVYIFSNGPQDVKAKLQKDLKLPTVGVDVSRVDICALSWDALTQATELYQTRKSVEGIKLSPDGKLLAIVEELKSSAPYTLLVVPTAGGSVREASARGNRFPDWSADSRSLTYIEKDSSDTASFERGALVTRTIADENGNLLPEFGKPAMLVDVPYRSNERVRASRDGRVFFCCPQVELPRPSGEVPNPLGLYCIDPTRYHAAISVVTPEKIPSYVGDFVRYFAVGPDGSKIAVPGTSGETYLITVANGEVESVQSSNTYKGVNTLPVFRSANELTFAAPTDKKIDGEPVCKVVLWNLGDKTGKDLSNAWSQNILTGWLAPEKKKK